MPKRKVIANDHGRRFEAAHKHLGKKLFRRLSCEFVGKAHGQHVVHPEVFRKVRAAGQAPQHGGHSIGSEYG